MIIVEQLTSSNVKYYVFDDIEKAAEFVANRCKLKIKDITTDTPFYEDYKGVRFRYIIKLAEKRF